MSRITATTFGDPLGARGRRTVLISSVVAGALIAAFVVAAVVRFSNRGQLAENKWESLTDWRVLRFLAGGLGNTVKVAITAMAIAIAVGALFALGRLARNRVTRLVAALYVEFFRGLPLYLLVLFCWLGLPRLDINIPLFWTLVLALSVYNSSIFAEIFRAGILSLDRGQGEAASAIGLGYWQAMGLVIVPQAVRRMVPAIVSQSVTLLKDTSLGILIGFEELLRRSELVYENYHNPVMAVALAALLYIAVNSILSAVATRLEARQRRRYQAGGIQVAGVEDLALTQAKADAVVTEPVK